MGTATRSKLRCVHLKLPIQRVRGVFGCDWRLKPLRRHALPSGRVSRRLWWAIVAFLLIDPVPQLADQPAHDCWRRPYRVGGLLEELMLLTQNPALGWARRRANQQLQLLGVLLDANHH